MTNEALQALTKIILAWYPESRCLKFFRKRNVELSLDDAIAIADAIKDFRVECNLSNYWPFSSRKDQKHYNDRRNLK